MIKYLLVLFLAVSALPALAELMVEDPWIMALPPAAKDTAAFMTLVNAGTAAVRITGGQTDAAKKVSPMVSTHQDGATGMKDVPFIEVPAGGKAVLKPGGDHLMLLGLKEPLKAGQKIKLELTAEPGGKTITVEAVVRRMK